MSVQGFWKPPEGQEAAFRRGEAKFKEWLKAINEDYQKKLRQREDGSRKLPWEP